MDVQVNIEMPRGFLAGAARALRMWIEAGPPPTIDTGQDRADWVIQEVGVQKLLDQIDAALLHSHSPDWPSE